MTKKIYIDTVGYEMSIETLNNDGTIKSLADATVTVKLYEIGTNTLKWSHEATIDNAALGQASYTTVAGDLDTIGSYYALWNITYDSGEIRNLQGETYEIETQLGNLVGYQELLDFMDIIPSEAKPVSVVESYLEEAEDLLDILVPSRANSSDSDFIAIKKAIIKRFAAGTYFSNMDENSVNPNLRLNKVKAWREEAKLMQDKFNEMLSSTAEDSTGIIRRVKNSSYSDVNSIDYEG